MSITILLADSHTLMRKGLRSLLEKQPGMEVVAEAEDGRTTVQLAQEFSPDVVIVEIAMSGLSGVEVTRRILAGDDSVKVVALSMHSDRRFVAKTLKAGASAYLLKDCAFEELVRAINTVMADQIYLSPEIAGAVVEDYVRRLEQNESSASSILTPRECEVLQLLAEGKNIRQIASRLRVSVKTVGAYRRRIEKRLDVHSIADLTKDAIRTGLTSLEP